LLTLLASTLAAASPPEEPIVRIAAFELRGAGELEDELLERLVTRDRGWALWRARPVFDEDALDDDVERAIRFHRSEGYYSASVEALVERDASRDEVRITLVIERGEPTLLRSLDVGWKHASDGSQGAGPLELEPVLDSLPLRVGERFGGHGYQAAREALLEAIAEAGYPLASLAGGARVILEEHAAYLEWQIDPGPSVRLGPINILGLEHADEILVRRALTIAPGDTWSPSALRASERAIYASGLFRSVAARPIRPQEPDRSQLATTWPIELTLQERERRSIRIGGGWGTEDEFRVRGEWHHRNLFGQAESFDISGKYSSIIAGGEARYRDPSFIDPDIQLDVPLGFERATEPGFDVNRTFIGFELSRTMFDHWRFAGTYRFELANPTDIDTDPFANDEDSVLISRLGVLARRAEVDDLFEPTRGSVIELALRPTLSALGADFDSIEVTAGFRWYRAWRGIVLALRAEAGTIEPVGTTGQSDIPVFERFFAGGSSSVRGYDRHRIGLLDDDGDPLGGLSWAEASAELRFPIWRALGGVLFFDAGQIRLRPHDWSTHDIFPAFGGGIRIRTPVGPIRFDVGLPFESGLRVEDFEIHFSIGHAF
jgi:outer membrane translocation and assembly module TamA